MRTRGLLTLPVIAIVALALALGSVGTATAGGLTKGAVKKIASKVVSKKSSSLSVAHAGTATTATTADSAKTATTATTATNATNATQLAGLPANVYLDQATVYTIAVTTSSTSHSFQIPVTAGQAYRVSYAAYMSGGGSNGTAYCELYLTDGSNYTYYGESRFAVATGTPSATGTGVMRPAAGQTLTLQCGAPSAWTTSSDEPVQIVVSPITVTSGNAITPSLRGAALAAH